MVEGSCHDSASAMILSRPGIWNMHSEIFDDMRMCTTKSRMSLYPYFALSVLNMLTQFNESV